MLDYAAPTHRILTIVLIVIYVYLAFRFFRSSREEASTLDRLLVHIARYSLLLVFISGLILNITLGKLVSQAHHIISIIPAVLVVGIKYLPSLRRKPNTLQTYAWVFILLFILMIVLAVTAHIPMMPQF